MKKEKGFFGFGRNVFFTGLVSFFMDVSSEMIYPLVPLFLTSVLGVNMSMIGLIERGNKRGNRGTPYLFRP